MALTLLMRCKCKNIQPRVRVTITGRVHRANLATLTERVGFGSFHSEDIEVLVRQVPMEYSPLPTILADISARTDARVESIISKSAANDDKSSFWKSISSDLFHLDRNAFTFINHGAFGAAMVPLLIEANEWRLYCERQPLNFFDRTLLPLTAHILRETARHLCVPTCELYPLANVTSGLNSVMQSVRMRGLNRLDNIVAMNVTYGSTKKMLNDLAVTTGAEARLASIPFTHPSQPVESFSPSEWTSILVSALLKHVDRHTRLVILDQITSNTAMEMPVAEMAAAVKQVAPHAVVCVDAAHALFALPSPIYATPPSIETNQDVSSRLPSRCTNVEHVGLAANVDVWLTNAHKWLAAPKGAAFMWINPEFVRSQGIRPAILSHGYEAGEAASSSASPRSGAVRPFDCHYAAPHRALSAFAWDGCRDYAALLTVPSALRTWARIANVAATASPSSGAEGGGSDGSVGSVGSPSRATRSDLLEAPRARNVRLAQCAEDLLAQQWGVPASNFLGHPSQRQPLPMRLVPLPWDGRSVYADKDAFRLQEKLFERGIEVPVKCIQNKLYIRISAHVYNEEKDYKRLADSVQTLFS